MTFVFCDEEQDDYILDYIIEDEEDLQPLPCALEGYFAADMQK